MRLGKRWALPGTPDGRRQDLVKTAKTRVCAKAWHPFRVVEQHFGFQKTRRRGTAKNRCKVNAITALTNPFPACRLLLATTSTGEQCSGRS